MLSVLTGSRRVDPALTALAADTKTLTPYCSIAIIVLVVSIVITRLHATIPSLLSKGFLLLIIGIFQ